MPVGVLGALADLQTKKKPGITRAFLRQQIGSACDLNQVSHLLDGAPAVGPFDVSFITHD